MAWKIFLLKMNRIFSKKIGRSKGNPFYLFLLTVFAGCILMNYNTSFFILSPRLFFIDLKANRTASNAK